MSERTLIVSVHPFRRTARQREREVQHLLGSVLWLRDGPTADTTTWQVLDRYGVPPWAKGVRVEKAGRLSWAVIATSHRRH